ncbi:hypothetical protein [Pedobacter africanus]|uniref:Uncharacterized protein n=1 Tax=Pedobacter africanus TaxID=151894 RepID=A0ACC6KRK6_9SPHI|nr:hypothetical protein [Pedobacter africanus]MDR6781959.1 hypothetical protein [Pedobacter africanus]
MEKQIRDQQSKALEAIRKKQGLSDFQETEENDQKHKKPDTEDDTPPADALAPFRRSGEPGSRK